MNTHVQSSMRWAATAAALMMLGCGRDAATGPEAPGSAEDQTIRIPATSAAESALLGLERAYTAQDLAAVQRLFGGAYVFHCHPDFLGPETLDRNQSVRALRTLFNDPEVESVLLDLDYGPAEPAGDLAHPRWMEFSVTSLRLEVTRRRGDGEPLVIEIGGPARFVVGPGPSAMAGNSWQIMSQWDLFESNPDGGERASSTIASTWSELLVSYVGATNPGGGR